MDPRHVSLLWALAENAAEIAKVHGELFSEAWDQNAILDLLERPGATPLIARANGLAPIAGFIFGQIAADEAEILSIGVRQPFQRRGLGRHLIEGLIRSARKAEVNKLFLEVAADNVAALGLYNGMGFKEAGRRKGYYQRPGGACDAITMALPID